MKIYSKLKRFPLGSIHAEGFLKEQMLIGKDGICGHLHELEPQMIADPYVNRTYVEAWDKVAQLGWGGEISANYWTGYIQYAFTLNDEEMIKTATNWVNAMMKKQRDDGYLGTYDEEDAPKYDDYNAWSSTCAMRGLIAFYEATGREDVIEAVHRCMLWFCNTWTGDKKTCYVGQGIIEGMIFTYYHTGDERLVAFAEEYLEFLCKRDVFKISYKSMLKDDYFYNSNHGAGMGVNLRLPALVYSATGKEEYLKASLRKTGQVLEKSNQLSGSPVSVTEYLGPVSSTTETEYCSYAFYNCTYSYFNFITGDPYYGDLMERMFYNGAQGARKKDEKAIAYLNAPNQIFATMTSSSSMGDMQVYAPCYPTSCCPVNAVAVIPEFIRGMLLCDNDDNVYVSAYGPCSLNYKDISIREKTNYPFRNSVVFEISCEKEFAMNLKVPMWSKGYTVKINGEKLDAVVCDNGYVTVARKWEKGDEIEISFKAEVEIIKVDDTDGAAKYPMAIRYGALLFAYHIPEKWEPIKGNPMTELPEGWSWFDVNPDFKEADVEDLHEMIGSRRYQFSWNVALDENLSPEDVTVEELPESGYVWANPMIKLHTHCYKAPYLCAPYQSKTLEPNKEYQYVTDKLPLVLEPYGCTNLRITYFPKADLENKKEK
ncbi:MAG: glycoside hydrolase family 127 protein [Clostridia bacterium]|nr:glycoside hydrolase family 127 protein [Clostridia bacterium]